MFAKLLIANRGEIACRIHRTAHRMGIRTVAVYSEADRHALHVRMLDESVLLGPSDPRQSYLVIDRILEAARATGAEAIHPGYGFLSENADFAAAVANAGLAFIGPGAETIRLMGSKSAAKDLMQKAGVPILPGYHGAAQDYAAFAQAAEHIGYPVLIKAAFGGGGRGMRIVASPEELAEGLAAAAREAQAAFGNARLLLEKYLPRPRHIEVQIFGDRQGHLVHLFERDCSLQRRHQKVVEESPAPGLNDAQRARLTQAAIEAARAVHYENAGTVEFIFDSGDLDRPYFMEMNTRLQVEHPVTEAITGLDLVEWQLRVATGEELPLRQEEIVARGHAIEMRLCAEDPTTFLPSSGDLLVLREPGTVRVDSGYRQGDRVGTHYDSLLAKLVAWAPSRSQAIEVASAALAEMVVLGVTTNRALLTHLLDAEDFARGAVETSFIAAHPMPHRPPSDRALLALAWAIAPVQEGGPWARGDGWRLSGAQPLSAIFARPDGEAVTVTLDGLGSDPVRGAVAGRAYRLAFEEPGGLRIDGAPARATIAHREDLWWVALDGEITMLRYRGPFPPLTRSGRTGSVAGGEVLAPMPGRIVQLLVENGKKIDEGETLLILEAMKMEHRVTATRAGKIGALTVQEGDQVAHGTLLLHIEADG
ncbi:MAG TPA: acetyl-CoA carboxylase biotin carboxylase subunit [Dongiaceae bacterium]|jgi:3-methylcrotonyl-CoA carboxylase alpha subunit|nr:acetyl-CoA carboxylase biotin carboxylase subunit [Dongiaceae bacterium]